jgi:formylmethanofuran dehydrogenase subunit E
MTTQVDERPELKDADTGPEMFHYVRKEKIAESAVMGTMVVALCGETFPVTRAAKPGSPVCPACREIYESLTGD